VQAYLAHCLPGSSGAGVAPPPPAWCSSRLPSVYGFIQREYWDVGLLRFFRDPGRVRPLLLLLLRLYDCHLSLLLTWGSVVSKYNSRSSMQQC
jgi:hypothetical protein